MAKKLDNIKFEEHKDRLIITTSDHFCVPREDVGTYFDKKIKEEGELDDEGRYDMIFQLKRSAVLHFSNKYYEKTFDTIIIGETKKNDFGKKRKYEEAIQIYRTNPQKAIEEGFTNEKGQPIEIIPYDKNKKRVMDSDNLYSKTLYGITKINDKIRPIQITLRDASSNLVVPLFKKIKINGYQVKKDETDWIFCNSTLNTEIKVINEKIEDITKYLYLFDKEMNLTIKDIENPKEVMRKKVEFFIKKSTISIDTLKSCYKITFIPEIDEENKNDLNSIVDLVDNRVYCGFIDEKPDYVESGEGYIVARSYEKRDGNIGFEILGIYISKPYLL